MLEFKCIPEGHGSFSAIPPSTFGFPKIFPSFKMQPQPSTLHYFHKKTSRPKKIWQFCCEFSVESRKPSKWKARCTARLAHPRGPVCLSKFMAQRCCEFSVQSPRTHQNGKREDQHSLAHVCEPVSLRMSMGCSKRASRRLGPAGHGLSEGSGSQG